MQHTNKKDNNNTKRVDFYLKTRADSKHLLGLALAGAARATNNGHY